MNSFDVFDTLLARRYLNSEPVWLQLERESEIADFANLRKAEDTGSRNLYEIYDVLVAKSVVPQSLRLQLLQREIELEIQGSIPVRKNLDRVQHGDMLISDMYLPAAAILQLVRSVGMDKQVTLYQSNGDKSNGTVWPRLKNKPDVHLGDNRVSDYDRPTNAGVNAEWYNPATELNAVEHSLVDTNLLSLGLLTREIRLGENYTGLGNEYFASANNHNLPLLFFLAELINKHYGHRNIVFLGRDCQLLHRLYNAYYDPAASYLPFSRQVAYDTPEAAVEYLKAHAPERPLFIDLSSTGGTWEKLQSELDVLVAIYSDTTHYTPEKPVLPKGFGYLTSNSQIGQTNLLLEVMNCGDHGHLDRIEIHDGKLMQVHFAEPELPEHIVSIIHKPVQRAVALADVYRESIRKELRALDDVQLLGLFGGYASAICSRQDLQLDSFLKKETAYLEQFTK
jgi:hypothetical protein